MSEHIIRRSVENLSDVALYEAAVKANVKIRMSSIQLVRERLIHHRLNEWAKDNSFSFPA